ncbi:MAG: isoprenylcysteine carboxylmethyltransferase family protein [Thermodesulfobacteriota bacterium]|nr:isoprenylcysteine carboxylmethyltransferase family protein [Thermodesulfobacteriota bacterium]
MSDKRVLPPTYLFLAIVVMVMLHFLFPAVEVICFPWKILGAIPLVFGIVINTIASNAFDGIETTVKPFEESTALIMTGVFRISRHPMYLGMVFILIGIAILMGSLTPYTVIPVFAIVMDMVFIRVEEGRLEEKFGGSWLEYKDKVRRWI